MRGGRQVKRCAREGCRGQLRKGSDHQTCSMLCALVMKEMAEAENVSRATGDTELWSAAVTLNDALTEHYAQFNRVYQAAKSAGFTNDQWAALKRGLTTDEEHR